MSLMVPPSLVEQVEKGPVSDADFVECIRMSLPGGRSPSRQRRRRRPVLRRRGVDDQRPRGQGAPPMRLRQWPQLLRVAPNEQASVPAR